MGAAPKPVVAPIIREAFLASGPSMAVEWGAELTEQDAINRRRQGLDIVVIGVDEKENRKKAQMIESAVGGKAERHPPHGKSQCSLPHYHQESRFPDGHCFYELNNSKRKARRKR